MKITTAWYYLQTWSSLLAVFYLHAATLRDNSSVNYIFLSSVIGQNGQRHCVVSYDELKGHVDASWWKAACQCDKQQ